MGKDVEIRTVSGVRPATNLRWWLVVLLFFGMAIQSLDRVNLGAALPLMNKTFHLTPVLDGFLLSAFFWTYAVSSVPGGYVVDRVRPRIAFIVVGLWWSVISAGTALVSSFASLLGVRALLGIGEAGDFPTASKVVREWFPPSERGLAAGIFSVGNDGGVLIALPLASVLLLHFGWQGVFLGSAIVGLVWVTLWWLYYYSPGEHPKVTQAEREYVTAAIESQGSPAAVGSTKRRWLDLLKYRQTWGLIVGYFCYPYLYAFFLTWFPVYLVQGRHFSLAEMGLYGGIPPLFALVGGGLGGKLSDYLLEKTGKLDLARKVVIGGGMVIGALAFMAVAIVPTPLLAVVMLTVTTFFMRMAYGPIWALPGHVSPSGGAYTGSIAGLMNAFGNLGGGVVAPIVTGFLVSATGSFTLPLLLGGTVAIVGALAFMFMLGPIRPLWGGVK